MYVYLPTVSQVRMDTIYSFVKETELPQSGSSFEIEYENKINNNNHSCFCFFGSLREK